MAGEWIDAYCERTAPGLLDEPLNLLTNLAFIAAAGWVARRLHSVPGQGLSLWDCWLLVFLLAAIGVGSALWHAFATRWAELADVIPIGLFICLYLGAFLRRVAGWAAGAATAGVAAFLAAAVALGMALPADLMNGSVAYLPAYLALLAITAFVVRRRPALARPFLVAAGLFTLSLTARTLDLALCPAWSAGTHFVWHLCNAEVLRRLLAGLLDARLAVSARRAS